MHGSETRMPRNGDKINENIINDVSGAIVRGYIEE